MPTADGVERNHAGTRFLWVSKIVRTDYPATTDIGSWSCQRCGSFCEDFLSHGDWHAQMDRAIGRVEGLGL